MVPLPTDSAVPYTPSLTINTNTGGNTGPPSQLGPNTGVTSFAQQTQTPISANANSPYLGFGYKVLGVGLPGMNVLGTMGGGAFTSEILRNSSVQQGEAEEGLWRVRRY